MRTLQLFVVALFCTITIAATAQKTEQYYNEQFAQIDSLVKKQGLNRSALDKVHLIYGVAKADKNYPQLIKALQYRMLLLQELEENSFWKQLDEFEQEARILPQPAPSVLNSIIADFYRSYLQLKQYTIANRTSMVTFKPEDHTTWAVEDFKKKITEKFLLSISEKELLQRTKVDAYTPIMWPGNVRHLRPTLFDLLAHRAIDYFEDASLDEPENAAHAFSIYLDLMELHSKDASPAALIDVKISQLNFMHNISVSANKDSMYIEGLLNIVQQYPAESEAGMAWYHLADFYKSRGERYSRLGDTAYKYDYVTVKNICEKVLALPDSTPAKAMCQEMMWQIMQKDLSFKAEKVNIPGKPFRVLVKYRNVDTVYLRVIKVRTDLHHHLFSWNKNDSWWQWVLDEPVFKTFVQTLPGTGDLRDHSVEIKMDALPPGEYVLLGSSNKKFELNKDPMALQQFFVSRIAYVNRGLDFFVLDRETGRPLNNAKVLVYNSLYNSNINRWGYWKREKFRTDRNGYFRCGKIKDEEYGYLTLDITIPGDRLFIGKDEEVSITTKSRIDETLSEFEEEERHTYLFTDRSIYRPGQTVWFKGISITTDFITRKPKLVAGKKTKVFLHDANNSIIDTLMVTTNDYGSFSGKFTLPENTLNGRFSLQEKGYMNFSVEEYKRPKFFVSYENTANTYRINDVVQVAGVAKAYAGNNITGASVKYRVMRKSFSSPKFYRIQYENSNEQQVAQGETTTDAEGKFQFKFVATPEARTADIDKVMLSYSITCEVTDINGETRTETTSINASNVTLVVSIDLPAETLPADSLKGIIINSKNISRQFVPSFAHVTVQKLQAPQRLTRQREWEEPDQFIMSKEEYQRNFPYDEYSHESQPHSWQKLEKVIDFSDSIRSENAGLNIQRLKPGWYFIKAIAYDKYGKPAETETYVHLTANDGAPASPMYKWEFPEQVVAAPEQTVNIHIGSSAENVFAIGFADEDVDRPGVSADTVQYRMLNIDNRQVSLPYHVTEADRGNFIVRFLYVKHNRVYTYSTTVVVPWSNKEAVITYESFRDRSMPGSRETWKVKLSGNKKEKIAAEMLTAMYDASLDQFEPHAWFRPEVWPVYDGGDSWEFENAFEGGVSTEWNTPWYQHYREVFRKEYDILLLGNRVIRNADGSFRALAWYYDIEGLVGRPRTLQIPDWSVDPDGSKGLTKDSVVLESPWDDIGGAKRGETMITYTKVGRPREVNIPDGIVRTNLAETAFFFPHLHTDSSGSIEFSFTLPEAVTKWKWIMLAHSRELAMAYDERTMVTQKQLMVQPNVPRFLREGDNMVLNTKVVNMSDSAISGQARIAITDAITGNVIESWIPEPQATQNFSVCAGESAVVTFPVRLPKNFSKPVAVRFIANAGNISDGEEHTVPVLSNRMMVTETLPLNIRPGEGGRNFTFEKLTKSADSKTLTHHSLTLEFTANPAWYVVQSLPYLMEYPYECSEQLWNRVYANALASKIIRSAPRIDSIFEQWRLQDTTALFSALQKNEELKSAMLQETPWVMDATNEREQRKRLALLFDIKKMSGQFDKALQQLSRRQSYNGGIAWFEGGYESRFITQYILTGIGHLKKLQVDVAYKQAINDIVSGGLSYLSDKLSQDYYRVLRGPKTDLSKNHLGEDQIGYLYMLSFFPEARQNNSIAVEYFSVQAQRYWVEQNKFMQGMIALALYRQGDTITPRQILRSLKEKATVNDEMGMYWKDVTGGYYWYQSPVETQSLLIEAFSVIANDTATVDALRTWLLKHKQTNSWSTTKATAEACYALLLQGSDWLSTEPVVQIKLGDKNVSSVEQKTEAGSGYFKKVFDAQAVSSNMGNIKVNVAQPNGNAARNPSWGAVYWQYFENLENITSAETPLKLSKKLFAERNTDRGPVLEAIDENSTLKVGDKIKVRIVITVDRDMEFVHMKDMRASALEPVNVLSEWKWQGGLGYYESTKDASTNFFFSDLPKGTYVFEYPLYVTHPGTFSNGIATIQCMYAPEFSSHSEGVKINVK